MKNTPEKKQAQPKVQETNAKAKEKEPKMKPHTKEVAEKNKKNTTPHEKK